MATSVYVDLDKTGQWLAFRTPYNREFVEELKMRVPARNRRWASEQKAWCVTRSFWNVTEGLLRKHYGNDLKFDVGPAAEAAHIEMMCDEVAQPQTNDYMMLGVRADAPMCVVHAAYIAIQAAWRGAPADRIQQMGIFPLKDTMEAYKRVCNHRGVAPAPGQAISSALAAYMADGGAESMLNPVAVHYPSEDDGDAEV